MPLGIDSVAAITPYASPFIGEIGAPAHVLLDVSTFTTAEIDADGYIKPGVPISLLAGNKGTRVGVEAAAGSAVAAAYAGNTGNGTMGTVTVGTGAKAGVYQLVIIEPGTNTGKFTVEDPDGITIGVGTVASAFSAGGLSFTLADGATDFVSGDGFTITVTLTAGGVTTTTIYGVTIEATKLPLATIPPTNTTLASETGDCFVAVTTSCLVNRDAAEDVLGRAYTAAELAAFNWPQGRFRLTTT